MPPGSSRSFRVIPEDKTNKIDMVIPKDKTNNNDMDKYPTVKFNIKSWFFINILC